MNDIFFYSIIFILLAGILCGGILGSIIIRRIAQMKDMLQVYCLTERQSRGRSDLALMEHDRAYTGGEKHAVRGHSTGRTGEENQSKGRAGHRGVSAGNFILLK